MAAAAGATPGPALRIVLASSILFNIAAAGFLLSVHARDDLPESQLQTETETPDER